MWKQRLSWLWLVLFGVLAPGPRVLQGQETSWKFVVFGDCLDWSGWEVNTNIVHELATAVVAEKPAFLLFAGDCSMSGSAAALQLWTNAMEPVYTAGITVYPAVGNHDFANPAAFASMVAFAAPTNGPPGEEQTTYSFAYSNALFVVVNLYTATNTYLPNQPWLDGVLSSNTQPHVFVMGHTPAFQLWHPDGLCAYPTNRDTFWNSLSNANARVYFSGHDHVFDHCQLEDGDGDPQNDLHQFVVGTGGAPTYPDEGYPGVNGAWTPKRLWHEAQFGYLSVEVAGENVSTTWHHRVGANSYAPAEVFSYSLRRLPFLHHSYTNGQLRLTWSGTAALQNSSSPAGPFEDVPDSSSPYSPPSLDGSTNFFRLRQ